MSFQTSIPFLFILRYNSFNPVPTWQNRCRNIKLSLYWTKFSQVIWFYCSYIWAEQLIIGVLHSDVFSISWFRGVRLPFFVFWVSSVSTRVAEGPGLCGSGVFTAEEVDVVGDIASGYTTTVELETRLEADFGGLPDSGDSFLHLSKYQDFRSLASGLKEFYCVRFLLIIPHSSWQRIAFIFLHDVLYVPFFIVNNHQDQWSMQTHKLICWLKCGCAHCGLA